MTQILSLSISIPAILTCFVGGLSLTIFPINDEPTIRWNLITFILWLIGLMWLGAMLLYRRQKVTVYVEKCALSKSSKDNYIIKMTILVSSRHPDILKTLELGLLPENPIPNFSTSFPHPISGVPERFDVAYGFSSNILDEAMIKQNTKWDVNLWVEAATSKSKWITDRFTLPARFIRDNQAPHVGISRETGSLNKITSKKGKPGK